MVDNASSDGTWETLQRYVQNDSVIAIRYEKPGAARGKQGHFVALAHEFFCQIGDDSLRATVQPGRNTFIQRSDLGDSQPQV